MKENDLLRLAEKEIEGLPDDGKERSISITVSGDNSGNIAIGGTHIVLESQRRKRTWADLTPTELQSALAKHRAQLRSSWLSFWVNTPAILLGICLTTMVAGLLSGWLLSLPSDLMPYLSVSVLAIVASLGLWLVQIRRPEAHLMQESRAYIDTIRAELRRRKYR